jgi:phospholipid/cholesterol/gamma-HCH transport system substrate-binding protein
MARSREYKVGAFVLAGMLAMGGVVFMIGQEKQLFKKKVAYETAFTDVAGLGAGSPVRMGGVDIGRVTKVGYSTESADRKIHVQFSVLSDQWERIKQDSVASIEGKGLLGDKMLVVSIGSAQKGSMPPGSSIASREAEDLGAMIGKFAGLPAKAEKVMDNLERVTGTLADENLNRDLKGMAASLNSVLGSVDRREGYVGKVLSDPKESERLSQVVSNLERVTNELEGTVQGVNQVVGRIRTGPGLLHEVVYGEDSSKAVAQFGGAAEELRVTLKGIREGNGVAKSLIYGDDQSQALMQNLNAMSGDLRQIVADVRAGKGTLGALMVDPSVYEDLKVVLGNVERNKALRALVRYSIRRDESSGGVHDTVAAPAAPPASAGQASGATLSGGLASEPRP